MNARTKPWLGAVLLLFCVGISGCFNPFFPTVSTLRAAPEAAPLPDSPQGVLKLFKWCWENQAITEYEELFTEDYRFAFAKTDSTGAAYQDWATTRDEDLRQTRNLFLGGTGSSQPPAQRVVLSFDANLIAMPDSRAGKAALWHKEIRTAVDLTIDVGSDVYWINGYTRFFVVRGDSAKIPSELVQRGFRPDAGRWYIERWEDETGSGSLALSPSPVVPGTGLSWALPTLLRRTSVTRTGASASAPTTFEHVVSWGCLKHLYSIR